MGPNFVDEMNLCFMSKCCYLLKTFCEVNIHPMKAIFILPCLNHRVNLVHKIKWRGHKQLNKQYNMVLATSRL